MKYKLIPIDIPNVKGEGRLVAIQREVGERTKSGLFVPQEYRENNKPSEADVIAVSPKVRQLMVGDNIVYNQYVGCEVKLGGQVYHVLRESDVLAIIVEDTEAEEEVNAPTQEASTES